MELLFTFEGIKLVEGEMPRVAVDAKFALAEAPETLANFRVSISMPLNRYDETLELTASRALETARALLNESVALRWMEEQSAQKLPPLCWPADASNRLIPLRFGQLPPEEEPG